MFAAPSLTALSAAAILLAVATIPAAADETTCRGKMGKVTVDDLRVPQNSTCELDRTKVKGSINVERGATLLASRVVVVGNVQAESAKLVSVVRKSRIGGSVQVVQGQRAKVSNSEIDGSIQLESNSGQLKVSGNVVGSDVQAFQNKGGVEIEDNVIDGNLQCKGNKPSPDGGDNTVLGSKEDQCSKL
jgi:hypothetical protein